MFAPKIKNDANTIAVIVPTWKRGKMLTSSLDRIIACDPAPDEIWVHVDAGDSATTMILEQNYTGRVRWIQAEQGQGPGGGRNVLAKAASSSILVSFDDDSWPLNEDFFARVAHWMDSLPDAGALAMCVTVKGQIPAENDPTVEQVGSFENCGVAYRRDAFLKTKGFLSLRYAYGMEESDLRLQLMDCGWSIYQARDLRVFHDSDFEHHATAKVNAYYIANLALLTVLRYPLIFWPYGMLQVTNRAIYSIRMKRYRGLTQGFLMIPGYCWANRKLRKSVNISTILKAIRFGKK